MKRRQREAVLVPPGAGRALESSDPAGALTIKLSSVTTGGAITVWESRGLPVHLRGPRLHCHPGLDEMFYILEGAFEFTAAGERFIAPQESVVFLPRGIFYSFVVAGEAQARVLGLSVPAGIEDFFEEVSSTVCG